MAYGGNPYVLGYKALEAAVHMDLEAIIGDGSISGGAHRPCQVVVFVYALERCARIPINDAELGHRLKAILMDLAVVELDFVPATTHIIRTFDQSAFRMADRALSNVGSS